MGDLQTALKDIDDAYRIFTEMLSEHLPPSNEGCHALLDMSRALDRAKAVIISEYKNQPEKPLSF